MSDLNSAPDAGGSDAVSVTPAANAPAVMTVSEAARALQSARFAKKPDPVAESAEPAAPQDDPVSAQADDAQPETADPVEATNEADPAAEPPIEPPRSWTKEAKERWQSLPRETQEYLAEREQERDREVRRSQNETAEKLKGLTAKEQQAEQVRQQYEAALPALLKTLQQQQAGEFADIQSMADVERLSREDPFRFATWQAAQMKIAAVNQEVERTQAKQAQEQQQSWSKFANEQDQKVYDLIPDLKDTTKAAKLQQATFDYLTDLGFQKDELVSNWNGQDKISFRDARMQKLVHDAARYQELKSKPPAPAAKPIPQVQRPGVSQPRGASDDAKIQALNSKLERTGSAKDAAALLLARRAARS